MFILAGKCLVTGCYQPWCSGHSLNIGCNFTCFSSYWTIIYQLSLSHFRSKEIVITLALDCYMCKIKNIAYFYVCKFWIPKSSLITRINYNPCVQAVHAVVLVHFRWYVPLGLCIHNQISTFVVCVITNTYTIIVQHMYLLNKAAYTVQKIVTRFLHFINQSIFKGIFSQFSQTGFSLWTIILRKLFQGFISVRIKFILEHFYHEMWHHSVFAKYVPLDTW